MMVEKIFDFAGIMFNWKKGRISVVQVVRGYVFL